MGGAVLTIVSSVYLGATGAIQWDVALPILLAGLGVLGIHPSFNSTPSA